MLKLFFLQVLHPSLILTPTLHLSSFDLQIALVKSFRIENMVFWSEHFGGWTEGVAFVFFCVLDDGDIY